MRIGSQQNLFTVQRKVQVGVNKLREPNIVWQDVFADVWCEVDVRRGKEQFDPNSKQRYSEEVWRFRTRFDEVVGIDASMRLLHEGQTFDIKAVLPDGQKRRDCIIECTIADAKLQSALLQIMIQDFIGPAKVGVPYEGFTVQAASGSVPYAFSAGAGGLPPGLSLSSATGKITGTPTSAGSYQIELQVTDAAGAVAALPGFDIVVEAA